MEQLSILFDCVRRSDWSEATLFCVDILPRVLAELVPASDVINRVISEFISPGQPHQVCHYIYAVPAGFCDQKLGVFGRPIHQKLGFTDTDLAENFNLADNIATTDVFYLLIAETSILRTLL